MKPYRLLTAIVGLVVISSIHYTSAQEFQNIIAAYDGEKVTINYDLLPEDPEKSFRVTVYASHDDYSAPLVNVVGDVGPGIHPGSGKMITWYLKNELPTTFNDNIKFRLVAGPLLEAPSSEKEISFLFPLKNDDLRKGKNIKIQWRGGSPDDRFQLSLYEGDRELSKIGTTENENAYAWKVPKDLDKEKRYKIRLTNTEDTDEYIYSGEFQVKGGFPLYLLAIPVAGGVAAGVLLGGGDNGDEPITPTNGGNGTELETLPGPADPNGINF